MAKRQKGHFIHKMKSKLKSSKSQTLLSRWHRAACCPARWTWVRPWPRHSGSSLRWWTLPCKASTRSGTGPTPGRRPAGQTPCWERSRKQPRMILSIAKLLNFVLKCFARLELRYGYREVVSRFGKLTLAKCLKKLLSRKTKHKLLVHLYWYFSNSFSTALNLYF